MNKSEAVSYIGDVYGVNPDFPWENSQSYAVFRHPRNKKWFALIMDIPRDRIGLSGTGMIDIINLKCGPLISGSMRTQQGVYPAYHMNKANWLSVALDGSADDETIKLLLDISFDLTAPKTKKRNTKLD